MNNLFFWKTWKKAYQIIFYCLMALVLFFIGTSIWASYLDDSFAITWSTLGNFEILPLILDNFQDDLFNFSIPADSYIFIEKFLSNEIEVSLLIHITHLLTLALAIIFISAAVSEFKKIAYFIGLGLLFFFFSGLNLENLGLLTYNQLINFSSLFGYLPYFDKGLLIAVILVYGLTTYYFKNYSPQTSYLRRLSIFTTYTSLLAVLIFTYTPHQDPYLYLTSYGTFIPLIAMILICLLSGYEIVRGFVYIITKHNNASSGKSLWHLLLIWAIYFSNLILLYLSEVKHKNIEIYYIPYTVILGLSLCLSVWGLKALARNYRSYMAYMPTALFSYLSLVILALSGLLLAYANANDPLIQSYKEVIIYLFLGLSFSFIVYVLVNFYKELTLNQKVYNILFRGNIIPLPAIWALGPIVILCYSIFNNTDLFVQQKIWGAYYNNLGFAHYHNNNTILAKQYYNLANQYIPANQHATYSLGMMARKEHKDGAAQYFFEKIKHIRPSVHSIIQVSDILNKQEKYFESIFALDYGAKEFEYNPQIHNNLAVLYSKINIPDSTFSHFYKGQKYSNHPVILANTFALWVKYDTFNTDIADLYKESNDIHINANRLAYLNKWKKYNDEHTFLLNIKVDSILDAQQFCYLYNYIYNHIENLDSTIYNYTLKLLKNYDNQPYWAYLNYGLGLFHYKNQNYRQAFYHLEQASLHASHYGSKYFNILGLWYLSFQKYSEAENYFNKSLQRGNEESRFNLAFCLTQMGRIKDALKHWKILNEKGNERMKPLAKRMLKIFDYQNFNLSEFLDNDDFLKFHYLIFSNQNDNDPVRIKVFESLKLEDLKARVLLHDLKLHIKENAQDKVNNLFEKIPQYTLTQETKEDFILTQLFYFLDNDLFPNTIKTILNQINLTKQQQGWQSYFLAINYINQQKITEAIPLLNKTISMLPFEDRPYLTLINVYKTLGDLDKAYAISLDAIKINPKNKPLLINYFQNCLSMNYLDFAEEALEELKFYVSEVEYKKLLKDYTIYRQKIVDF